MSMNTIRNTAIAGVAGVAMIAAGAMAAPTEAHANGKLVGALIGGAVIGTIIGAASQPAYAAPVYVAPAPTCYWQKQSVYDPYYGYNVWKNVKVCY